MRLEDAMQKKTRLDQFIFHAKGDHVKTYHKPTKQTGMAWYGKGRGMKETIALALHRLMKKLVAMGWTPANGMRFDEDWERKKEE